MDKKTAREAYWNDRSENYDDMIGPKYARAYECTAKEILAFLKPTDRVLEFACGTGIVSFAVAPHVARLQAIDISGRMIEHAAEKLAAAPVAGLTFEKLELSDPSLEPGSFDAVIGCNVLLYIDDPDETFARIRELLKDGGLFLSVTDCHEGSESEATQRKREQVRTGVHPYIRFFSEESLTELIGRQGFEILKTENLYPDPPNVFAAARKKG